MVRPGRTGWNGQEAPIAAGTPVLAGRDVRTAPAGNRSPGASVGPAPGRPVPPKCPAPPRTLVGEPFVPSPHPDQAALTEDGARLSGVEAQTHDVRLTSPA